MELAIKQTNYISNFGGKEIIINLKFGLNQLSLWELNPS
jgi:hypothetical protein